MCDLGLLGLFIRVITVISVRVRACVCVCVCMYGGGVAGVM